MKDTPNDSKYSWYVVSVLVLAYTFSFIDRQILSLLVEPMKEDLQISDTQISLLIGLSFALFYTLVGLPIGRLVDTKHRVKIITWGIVIWSLMTAGCGAAKNYTHLFLLRMGVGVGEAALSPAAFSIIADYFSKNRLGLATSVYNAGAYIGGASAMIIGGILIQALVDIGPLTLPVIGETFPWQLVFFAVGLPGILVALLMVTVREPRRTGVLRSNDSHTSEAPKTSSIPLKQMLGHLRVHRRTLLLHNLGFSLAAMTGYAISSWVPTFLIRTFEWPITKVGLYFGVTLVTAGAAGVIFGGWCSDWLIRKGYQDARMRVGLIAMVLGLIPAVTFPIVDNEVLCMALLALTIFILTFPMGSGPAGLQEFLPNQMRGQMSAWYLFILNMFGLALGPTLVALLTDYWFGNPQDLRYSLAVLSGFALTTSSLIFMLGLKPYRNSITHYQQTVMAQI